MRSSRPVVVSVLVFLFAVVAGSVAFAATINVPAVQATIQAAIDASVNGDVVIVAKGRYKENIDFKGKAITVKSTYETDASAIVGTIIDGDKKDSVVTFRTNETAASVIRGFTITNGSGRLTAFGYAYGGGVNCFQSSPTVDSNIIRLNAVAGAGGGVYCGGFASPTLTNNVISGNSAGGINLYSPSIYVGGGGVACEGDCSPTLSSNTISGNAAAHNGGGFYLDNSCSPTLTNNRILGNTANAGGGLFCINLSSPVLTNDTLSGNTATSGGGLYCQRLSSPILKNTIVALSTNGGGLYVDVTLQPANPSAPVITYCDFWSNTGGNYVNWANPAGPRGNLSVDPLFANASAGNYRLKSQGGRWGGTAWVKDTVSSPCLDKGDPASDFHLEPSPKGGRINMGYDGNTPLASKTPPPTVTAWAPKGTTVNRSANLVMTFSVEMVRSSVQAFLTINGVKASTFGGAFTWAGKKMTFNPTSNLAASTSYVVNLGTGARSASDVHLAKAFTWTFMTLSAAPALLTASAAPTASGAQVTLNLAAAANVTVSIRNLAGREVAILQPGELTAGMHSLLWSGKSNTGTQVPAGMYLLQVCAHAADGTSAQAVTALPLR